MKVLLVGATGSPYYKHCEQEVRDFVGASSRVGIIPAANVFDENGYYKELEHRFNSANPAICGNTLHIRWDSNWREALGRVDAVIVPGGNTYLLLKRLQDTGLLSALRGMMREGLPYIGSSAGANVLGPNILTTNDWNVVALRDFSSFGLVPFNINPHYTEDDGSDNQYAETRELRIREYHTFWNNPVIGLTETGVLHIVDSISLLMKGRAKIFLPNEHAYWVQSGSSLPESIMRGFIPHNPGIAFTAVAS